MGAIIGFKDLKVGEQIKAKGKLIKNGIFTAVELSVQPAKDHSSMNGPIQSIDYEKKTLRVLGREVTLQSDAEIMDAYGDNIGFQALKAGTMVKVKGQYSSFETFNASSVKIKDAPGYKVEKVHGKIEKIDVERNILQIDGLSVVVNEKTMIEGF